jgi:hypothetical protein
MRCSLRRRASLLCQINAKKYIINFYKIFSLKKDYRRLGLFAVIASNVWVIRPARLKIVAEMKLVVYFRSVSAKIRQAEVAVEIPPDRLIMRLGDF